jgi:hypothetical protein
MYKKKQPVTSADFFHASLLGYPIGQHIHDQIRSLGVIRFEMHRKVVRPIHAFVHHENTGLDDRAFTGL